MMYGDFYTFINAGMYIIYFQNHGFAYPNVNVNVAKP